MEDIKNLEEKIESLRHRMHSLILNKDYILSPEVLRVSQALDSLLNEYYRLKNKKVC